MLNKGRKEVRKMKSMKSVLSVLLLSVALWSSAVPSVEACDHDEEIEFDDQAQQ
jgi:hypothetical protein